MEVRAMHTSPLPADLTARPLRRERGTPAEQEQVQEATPQKRERHPILTAEEQQYFEQLFPESKGDAKEVAAYTEAGARPSTVSGSLVDRRV